MSAHTDRMPVACVTFDLDDTLWAIGPVIRAAEGAFYAWLERHCPRITAGVGPERLAAHRREWVRTMPELAHDVTLSRKRWLADVARAYGYGAEVVEPAYRAFWEARNVIEPFEEVPAALEAARARCALGVITNGNADVGRVGLGHFFGFVVTAADAGAAKPDPGIFRAAIARAGVAAEQVAHVGDDPERDVAGAAAVGMRTVWVNAAGEPWPSGVPAPDAEIRSLAELDAILARWT